MLLFQYIIFFVGHFMVHAWQRISYAVGSSCNSILFKMNERFMTNAPYCKTVFRFLFLWFCYLVCVDDGSKSEIE